MMNKDYIRNELQKATAEYIKAVRLAISRTKDVQQAIDTRGLVPLSSCDMNRIGQFYEDRHITLEAFLHDLESCYQHGIVFSTTDWLKRQAFPVQINVKELMERKSNKDEREKIKKDLSTNRGYK